MAWVGPRVSFAMSRNYVIWKFLRKQNRAGIPIHAVWFQAVLSILYVLSGTFEGVLLYCGFILQLSSALVVAGVFILRTGDKWDAPYKSPLYPLLPITFTGLSIWILIYLLLDKPIESLFGLGILFIGLLTYALNKSLSQKA
jgi:APA family basic amino acid/polyamine antiporter